MSRYRQSRGSGALAVLRGGELCQQRSSTVASGVSMSCDSHISSEEAAMTSHRFGIGEGVTYSEKRFPTGIWIAELIVVEQLSRDGAPGYRLLAQDGATEYVLGEHELSPSSEKQNDHSARGPDRSSPTQLALGVVSFRSSLLPRRPRRSDPVT